MSVVSVVGGIISILSKIFEVFPDWWRKRQSKEYAELCTKIRNLKLERNEVRRKMMGVTGDEWEEFNEKYHSLCDSIAELERMLSEKS